MMEEMQAERDSRSDAELMERLARGEMEPLGELYMRYGRMVKCVLKAKGTDLSVYDLEDLCHEVFLTLLDSATRYRHMNKLRGWLCGIAWRKLAGFRRRGHRGQLLNLVGIEPGQVSAPAASAEGCLQLRQEVDRTIDAVMALPESQRQVLLLHVVDNLDGAQIAETLGVNLNTVWTRLHRARARLRAFLEPEASRERLREAP